MLRGDRISTSSKQSSFHFSSPNLTSVVDLSLRRQIMVTIPLANQKKLSRRPFTNRAPLRSQLAEIDWEGLTLSIGITTALLIALQWEEDGKARSESRGVSFPR